MFISLHLGLGSKGPPNPSNIANIFADMLLRGEHTKGDFQEGPRWQGAVSLWEDMKTRPWEFVLVFYLWEKDPWVKQSY